MLSEDPRFYGLITVALVTVLLTHQRLGRDLDDMRWQHTIYSRTVNDTYGRPVALKLYQGKVLLIVNIASRCGLTLTQYTGLQELIERYEDRGLSILNFPCNQFGGQMPESDGQETMDHLRKEGANIGHIFAKIQVKGRKADPLYKMLTLNQPEIEWNFVKFLVDRQGKVFQRYGAHLEPSALVDDIERLLK
ncbi:uncharacterized protein LOC110184081 [Drosophila serrata]|uniref:uncharacterized protein LOC110184081 n=1 Tax=Drosophila serrata TaxID=7274 RepID=UPI000A1CF9C3|nr:uncharacterized protein LOC110184081 [Drosophila serrata]KAH8369492.1 hypothetical protein KR200_000658 [Drosophila serrata]